MKLAVKRLRRSDLSFFQAYFRRDDKAKQKGFNLDKSVLEEAFFPGLGKALAGRPKSAAFVDLELSGPGAAQAITLARKVKIDAKNFRLNGEYIPNPPTDPRRYSDVDVDDFVVMQFEGDEIPSVVRAVLISAKKAKDKTLHAELDRWFPKGSMRVITTRDIASIAAAAAPGSSHPFRQWEDAALVEEAALGSTVEIEALESSRRRARRPIDPAVLAKARASAEKAGIDGERLLDLLMSTGGFPRAKTHTWAAKTDPLSPYDFLTIDAKGRLRHVDAKSTAGAFENRIYLSGAEIRHALTSGVPYDIARLFLVSGSTAKVRIARDIAGSLEPFRAVFDALPQGVSCDALSFAPDFFDFEAKVYDITRSRT